MTGWLAKKINVNSIFFFTFSLPLERFCTQKEVDEKKIQMRKYMHKRLCEEERRAKERKRGGGKRKKEEELEEMWRRDNKNYVTTK